MTSSEWIVLAAGLAAIAWVNWYFFVASREAPTAAAATAGGVQQITIDVEGGYSPSAVTAMAARRSGWSSIARRRTAAPKSS
jgi:plastocyanin domain-containing protein